MNILKIANVNLKLLEKQRLALVNVLSTTGLDQEDYDQLTGLLNMLDAWSDTVFREVDIQVKEWFDKLNGNSYFSARVYEDNKLLMVIPMQYGYGSHSVDVALKKLASLGNFPNIEKLSTYTYCEENRIRYTHNKQENCLKRDVKSFGEE